MNADRLAAFLRPLFNSRGGILVLSAFFITVALGFATLAVDAGYIFVTQGQLQKAADAAALAALPELENLDAPKLLAQHMGVAFMAKHPAGGKILTPVYSDIEVGQFNPYTRTFHADKEIYNATRATARRSDDSIAGNLSLFFARIFGIEDVPVVQHAVAFADGQVVGVMGGHNVIPFTLHTSIVDPDGNGRYDIGQDLFIKIDEDKHFGNVGFLDFDGGSNPTPPLMRQIVHGYEKDFIIPPSGVIPVEGYPGYRSGPAQRAFEQIYYDFAADEGPIVYFPIHRSWSGKGGNTIYDVIDLLPAKVREVQFKKKASERFLNIQIARAIRSFFILRKGAGFSQNLQKPRLVNAEVA